MPARVRRRNSKFRVVEPNGRLVRGPGGNPVDGGGYRNRRRATRQARAINA